MRAASVTANTLVSSAAYQVRCTMLVSLLLLAASLSSLAQNIAVSPASLKFAKQLIDTPSASKPVTITNNGASAQQIVITMSGDYTETDNCGTPSTIAAGGSCTAKITFTPTIVGSIKGAASITDTSNNLLAFVGITGTGGAPVTTAPTSLAFTGGTIGTTSAAKTFKITNGTTAAVTINSITTNVSDYAITTGTCLTTPLAAKTGNCTVTVTVTPTSSADDGAIIITDNAPNAVPLVVKLTSAATAGTSPISLSKTSLTFKTLSGTTSAAQTITVTNTSASAVAIGTITASTDYTILNNTCPSSLAAAAKCTFAITFSPTFIGTIEGSVAIPVNTPNSNSPQLVNLTGTSEANLTVAPASITFKAEGVGSTSAATKVTITNNTASTVTLSNVAITGDFGIQLSGTTCSTGGTLLAAKSCTIEVQFSPTIAASIVGALTVTNTSSPDPLIIGLAGTGTAPACPNNTLLKGNYALMLNGWNSSVVSAAVGSFVADGAGNITTGLLDVNDQTNGPQNGTFTGTYCVGSNNLATIQVAQSGGLSGSHTYAIALNSVSNGVSSNGSIIYYDNSTRKASGLLRKQTTSAFSTGAINGNYALGVIGVDGDGARQGLAGAFTADGTANLTNGELDSDDNGKVLNATFTSSDLTVASNGRGTVSLNISGGITVDLVFYVVSGSEMLIMSDDGLGRGLQAGQVLQQSGTFTDASLNGISVEENEGLDTGNTPATAEAEVGLLTFNGSGAFSLSADDNDGGTLSSNSASGSYSVSSNGRVTLTGGKDLPVFYLIATNQAFSIGTGGSVAFGGLEPQSGSSFTNASLSGNYLGGSLQPVNSNVNEEVGDLDADGAGNFSGTLDKNGSGGPSSSSLAATTYVVSSNGRVIMSESGVENGILYIISTSEFVFLPTTTSDPRLDQFQH